ncbi:MAG: DNA primase, partial [Spirochaetia bacterium]|nr:DNA primase [Spirochaetia bacterium]
CITNKELHALLKRLPYSSLDPSEIEKFIGASCSAVPACTSETFDILQKWGATEKQLKNRVRQHPQFLLTIAKTYHLSYYYTSKLEKAFLSKKELERLAAGSRPIIDIDFKRLTEINLDNFVSKKGVKTGSIIISTLLQHKLICIENEKNNPFYFYNGHIWQREPDPWGMAYNILLAIVNHQINKCAEDNADKKDNLRKTLNKLEERKFRNDIVKDLSVAPGIFQKQILFDSPAIKETLTLQDGVMDFSGRKIIYRNSKPEEYRREALPYSVDQIMNAKEPKKFLAFMAGNFKNAETLETFLFYLSLIASRCTQYKYGGIFIGRPHTGKTTTIELLMKIYQNMIVRLPSEKLVSKGRNYGANGPDPYIARLIGKGAAVAQETERNGHLNSAIWKEMTGGDTLTARDMYVSPIDFVPTAQIIMASNHIPRFDNKDQATIDRMVIIPFLVEHKHGDKETKEQSDIINDLQDEYPAIVKLLAEYYIKFKYIHKGKLPLSPECAAYKDDYIQQQETDLDFFVENNIDFEKGEDVWVAIKDVYARYLSYFSYSVDINGKPTDKEAWSQSKFTRIMKHDYPEIRTKQKKINGYPEQIFQYMRLKPDEGQKGEKPLNTSDLNSDSFTDRDEEDENPWR